MLARRFLDAAVTASRAPALVLAGVRASGAGHREPPVAGASDGPEISLRLAPDVDAAGKARDALESLDPHLERELLQDMHLLVTELVTNSVRHAESGSDEPVHVEVSVAGDHVFVAVEDGGTGFEPKPRSAQSPRDSGWGLHLVELLSSRWGVSRGRRTRVWLELARNGRAAAV